VLTVNRRQPFRSRPTKEICHLRDARQIGSTRVHLFLGTAVFGLGSDAMLAETNQRLQSSDWTSEPSLSELLGDPIAQALMVADGVKCRDLHALFANVQCRQHPGKRPASR